MGLAVDGIIVHTSPSVRCFEYHIDIMWVKVEPLEGNDLSSSLSLIESSNNINQPMAAS